MRRSWKYRLFVRLPFWFLAVSVLLVVLLGHVPVRYTPLMARRAIQFRGDDSYGREQHWVPLDKISPELVKSVVWCEDQRFYNHHGFDFEELKLMWKKHRERGTPFRGCSTISQQTAKNVFTFGSPTIIRKVFEAYWTCLIELLWSKDRIMEVYLNVAEMGKGIYGAEAAARHYYGCPASSLDRPRSVAIAICLPSPLRSNPLRPTARERARRNKVVAGMR